VIVHGVVEQLENTFSDVKSAMGIIVLPGLLKMYKRSWFGMSFDLKIQDADLQ
jgi:hypothetical protein